jgi:hypothetical protein
MSLNSDNTNNSSSSAPQFYVIFYHLFQIMFQFFLLSVGLDLLLFNSILLAICLDLWLAYYLLAGMIKLFSIKLVMFYLLLL